MGDTSWSGRDELPIPQPQHTVAAAGELEIVRHQNARQGVLAVELLQELHRENALASVLVTHNLEFAERCDRVLRLKDGRLSPA